MKKPEKEPIYCERELPNKPFVLCKRRATMRIEMNGCFCSQHGNEILRSLRESGRERSVEKIR